MLHFDSEGYYGAEDASLTLSQLQNLPKENAMASMKGLEKREGLEEFLSSNDRHFLIDVSIPKVLFCSGRSVLDLIEHGVSKYLNFISVQAIAVVSVDGSSWEVPTTRRKIFQDKNLKLGEKRAIMELFKSTGSARGSQAIQSSANLGITDEMRNGLDENLLDGSVVEYLKSIFIDRTELVCGLVNGVCMIAQPASQVSTRYFLQRLEILISSLSVYDDGCPLLVPMYGNSDFPQAFARMASVGGAVYILNADEAKIRSEVSSSCRFVSNTLETASKLDTTVIHGISCIESKPEDSTGPTISVILDHSRPLEEFPTFAISLPSSDSGAGSTNVCPPGHTLIHFARLANQSTDTAAVDAHMRAFTRDRTVLFHTVLLGPSEPVGEDVFSLDSDFEFASNMFGNLVTVEP